MQLRKKHDIIYLNLTVGVRHLWVFIRNPRQSLVIFRNLQKHSYGLWKNFGEPSEIFGRSEIFGIVPKMPMLCSSLPLGEERRLLSQTEAGNQA